MYHIPASPEIFEKAMEGFDPETFKADNEFFNNLISSMIAERAYQMEKWGDGFDADNTANDWHAYISKYLGMTLVKDMSEESLADFRANLVKVITLAMAAIEWSERGMAPRHYDKAA